MPDGCGLRVAGAASARWLPGHAVGQGMRRRSLFDIVRPWFESELIVAGNEAEALAAHQDGMPFSAWIKEAGCARSTASKWAEACAVRIRKEINPATGRQESWLSGHDVAVLNDYRRQLQQGQNPAATLVSLSPGSQVLPGAWLPQAPEPAASSRSREEEREALELLQLRLAGLRDALELSAPLSTRETTLLLGVRPGTDPLGRGGIEARRLGRNLWQLRKAEAVAKRKGLW